MSYSEEKENIAVLEIIDTTKTPTKKPAAANRLANSPKTIFPSTPEKLKKREELAQNRKQEVVEKRVLKAKAEYQLANLF